MISSPKLTFSLIECLDSIDYQQVDNFDAIYDIWRICTKYFNIPGLSRQPYFEKLKKVIWNKTCLLHAEYFVRIRSVEETIERSSSKQEIVTAVSKQINVIFEGDANRFAEGQIRKVVAAIFYLRLKLINMILTFYNVVIDSQSDSSKSPLVLEMNFIPENHQLADLAPSAEDHINFSLLTPVLDLLIEQADIFKLWDFTCTLSETMFLVQKLIEYSGINNPACKTVYNYLLRIIEVDMQTKAKLGLKINDFGEGEERTKFSEPESYLKNIFHTMELLPSSEVQNETSIVGLLQKIYNTYIVDLAGSRFFDQQTYLSFLIVLSRVEVQLMSLSLIDGCFQQFDKYKEAYSSNVHVLFQLIFIKRLIIYCYDENDIFELGSVVALYNRLFDKFEEYINMLKIEKIRAKKKTKEGQRHVLSTHSIKNARTIKLLEEEIKKLAEEDSELQSSRFSLRLAEHPDQSGRLREGLGRESGLPEEHHDTRLRDPDPQLQVQQVQQKDRLGRLE